MKLEEDLKAVRYVRECIDLTVDDNGFVILPAWQFALFVNRYESLRQGNYVWIALVLILAFFVLIMSILG